MKKTRLSLNVNDLDKALDFYRDFLRSEPAKVRPGYASFDLVDPPLTLALNESRPPAGHLNSGVRATGCECSA